MRSIEVKAAVIMALLFMILMRLVWMDTRSYVIVYAPENHRSIFDGAVCQKDWQTRSTPNLKDRGRPSWGGSLSYRTLLNQSCRSGFFSEGSFIRYNQGLLVLTVLACMILARIVTRSWVLALFVGLALFSRGRLIASGGQISGDHLIMFGVSLWAMFMAHWIRSGSRLILALLLLTVAWLVDFEMSFILLALVPLIYALTVRTKFVLNRKVVKDPILFWPQLQRFLELQNFNIAAPEQPTGGIFRPLPQTYSGPLRQGRVFCLFLKDYAVAVVVLMAVTLLYAQLKSQWDARIVWQMAKLNLWGQLFMMPVDRDILLSLAAILSALAVNTFVLPALRGLNYSIVLGILLSAIGVLLIDHIYLPAEATGYWMASQVVLWWEPLVLTLGVLGFYHSLITVSNRLWKRFVKTPATL